MDKQTKNLLIFFAATFVWTWAFYTPIAIGGHNPYQMPWIILLIFGGSTVIYTMFGGLWWYGSFRDRRFDGFVHS